MIKQAWLSVIGLSLVAAGVGYGVYWLHGMESYRVIDIMAAYDVVEQGLPVYAQFITTQRVQISEQATITELTVPLYTPSENTMLQVSLLQNKKILEQWQYQGKITDQATVAHFSLSQPRTILGELDVQFSAPEVTHEDKDIAPRVFIETADAAYPHGNYRIASNEKKGDIGLTLVGQQTRFERLYEEWRDEPREGIKVALQLFWMGLLIGVLPTVVWRGFMSRGITLPPHDRQDATDK